MSTSGLHLFLELKDREFGVGDGYAFVPRLTKYGASHGIIATMTSLTSDAKKHLYESAPHLAGIQIRTLEGADQIQLALPKFLNEFSTGAILWRRLGSGWS